MNAFQAHEKRLDEIQREHDDMKRIRRARPKLVWKRRAVGGWITDDGYWRIRGPIMGAKMYWLYDPHSRYTPTGRYDDSVNFPTVAAAKRFAETAKRR